MPLSLNQTTHRIIGAGMRVHRKVGPGLLESAYQLCFDWELKQSGLRFVRQHPIPLVYAQMLTYLRLTGCPVGLVLNFCEPVLKDGIMRVANGPMETIDDELITLQEDGKTLQEDENRPR
jgi:PD-(D/E)XK nuclease superfamily